MDTPTCATCLHFTRPRDGSGIGRCDLGGPSPGEGCSDVGEQETCKKHEPLSVAS